MRKGLMPYDIDIILPFLNFPSKVAYYLYKLLPTAKFTFWHQLGMDIQKADVFETIAANNIPCVIANAPNGLDYFREDYHLEEKRAFVLPQYLSMEYVAHDKNSLRSSFNIDEEAVVVGMISHYRPEKFQVQLLDVFSKLEVAYPQVHLVLLGNKNSTVVTAAKYKLLSKQIKEKGLSKAVSLLSEVPAEKVLSMIDVGVLLSSIEGMPNVVMEYMLYGLPIVSTNHPGCVELLKDSPFLIENEDNEIYTALEKLVVSSSLRKKEGDTNAAIIKKYTKQDYINKLTNIMNQFVKN
jgi:glycosyltransferase involved in cell wall biosynthesis